MALLIVTNVYLLYFGENGAALEHGLIGLWYVWLVMLPVTLGEALFGHSKLLLLLRCLGSAWGLAALCAVAMYFARDLMMTAWNTPDSWFGHAMQSMTFRGVLRVLGPVSYTHLDVYKRQV